MTYIMLIVIGVAGFAGFQSWPLYCIPIFAAAYLGAIEVISRSLVKDARHARMNFYLHLLLQFMFHCVQIGVLYGIGFGVSYLLS